MNAQMEELTYAFLIDINLPILFFLFQMLYIIDETCALAGSLRGLNKDIKKA